MKIKYICLGIQDLKATVGYVQLYNTYLILKIDTYSFSSFEELGTLRPRARPLRWLSMHPLPVPPLHSALENINVGP